MRNLAFLLVFLLLSIHAHADAVSINVQSGSIGGQLFNDLDFRLITDSMTFGGFTSYPADLSAQLLAGHISLSMLSTFSSGPPYPPSVHFELLFDSADIGTPFNPLTVTRSFTMLGTLNGPSPSTFGAIGTFTAGYLPGPIPTITQYFGATFTAFPVPEPTIAFMTLLGLAPLLGWCVHRRRLLARSQ